MDTYGWCSKISGEGCPVGQTYAAGVCCVEANNARDITTYPGKCILCDFSCKTCSGTLPSQCLSCSSFMGLRLNSTSCSACTSPTCLKCDSDPNICDIPAYTLESCRDRCNSCLSGNQCNNSGCDSGYGISTQKQCFLCAGGCQTCTAHTINDCSTCRTNFNYDGLFCLCDGVGYKQNTLKQPNLCNLCPDPCSTCSSDNVCDSCLSQFKLDAGTCSCRTTDGFALVTPLDCQRCTKGCKECASNTSICSGTECRTGYVDFPNCLCPIERGFREDLFPAQGDANSCLPCTAGVGCHQCLHDSSICSGCRLNHSLNLTLNRCECESVLNCLQCDSNSLECDIDGCLPDFTRSADGKCSATVTQNPSILTYSIQHHQRGDQSLLADAVFEISLVIKSGEKLQKSFAELQISDLAIFKTSPPEKIKNAQFKELEFSKIQVLLTFQELKEGEELEVEFIPDTSKYTVNYQLEGDSQKFTINFSGEVDPENVKSNQNLGSFISNISTYSAIALETSSLAVSFFFFDPSGSLMKLSQMMKIYCRFRFFDVNYGAYLGSYFEFSAKKFDPPTSKPLNTIVQESNKYYGNLLWKKVALDIFEVNLIRVIFYGASWILKILTFILLWRAINSGKVGKAVAHMVSISQKIHMISLNSVAVDLIPYTLITLFHTRNISIIILSSSGVLLSLLIYDYCEIWSKGGFSIIKEFKDEHILEQSSIATINYHQDQQIDGVVATSDQTSNPQKTLDEKATIQKLRRNITIMQFCTNDLKQNQSFSQVSVLLMCNFSFLLKLSLMQVIFVAMAMNVIPGLAILILLEVLYLLMILVPYCKHIHLRSFLLLIPKVT